MSFKNSSNQDCIIVEHLEEIEEHPKNIFILNFNFSVKQLNKLLNIESEMTHVFLNLKYYKKLRKIKLWELVNGFTFKDIL